MDSIQVAHSNVHRIISYTIGHEAEVTPQLDFTNTAG